MIRRRKQKLCPLWLFICYNLWYLYCAHVYMFSPPLETRCDNPGYAAYSTRSSLVDDNVFTPGDMVSYSCLQGFYISGDAALTCGVDGQWSSPRPTCVGKLLSIKGSEWMCAFIMLSGVAWVCVTGCIFS